MDMNQISPDAEPGLLGELDHHLLAEGRHFHLHQALGAHVVKRGDVEGVRFAVWAPNAMRVSVVGDFNGWDSNAHILRKHAGSGVFQVFVPGIGAGALYKYEIQGLDGTVLPQKADPLARAQEMPPRTASMVVGNTDFPWTDRDWHARAKTQDPRRVPVSIYEVHLGSWMRDAAGGFLSYRDLADRLIPYVKDMGFTHIELMPIAEHPFYGSWGYQPLGLFAPTCRYGAPDDLRAFIDRAHAEGIGVHLDWVVSHFPEDVHGLKEFDGTALYEHADPRQSRQQEWNTLIYNYGRTEVANFLVSNALYWLDEFHMDGLRMDAVASVLYLDYAKQPGEWVPNIHGGRENLEAVSFLREMNEAVYGHCPGAVTVAEESTSWPMVSRPVYLGGLGFGFKWNMGWMNDTLRYMGHEPIHRKYHHNNLTFGLTYAFSENFVLPLSHDEMVYGKKSLLGKMPGDRWQRFANLRVYLAFFFTHPGKKLLFMGAEFGQEREWNHESSLDWHLLENRDHKGVQSLVRDLNGLYRGVPALHERDCEEGGFRWINADDQDNNVYSYMRIGADPARFVVVVCNFSPVVHHGYRIGVARAGQYREILNTDSEHYGGSNVGNGGVVTATSVSANGQPASLTLTLPPLAAVVFQPV